jgi:glycosyltransferase involved in cell wall biosynthesis
VPILGYFEFYYRINGQDVGFDPEFPVDERLLSRISAMNTINLLALSLEQHGHTPTRWQLERYPDWARGNIKLLPEGAPLDICKPDPGARKKSLEIAGFRIEPKDRLVTYVARNLEPYRGFHTMMRALAPLLKARRDVKVVMVGGDDVSYGPRLADTTWRAHYQQEQAGRYDTGRVLFPGQVPYPVYLQLLQRSDCHVYLSYPFVASWSLREAMAAGCAIVGADVEPVREFITDGRTGLLTSCLDPAALAGRVQTVLGDERLNARLRAGARRHAERHLDMKQHLRAFEARIAEITGLEVK